MPFNSPWLYSIVKNSLRRWFLPVWFAYNALWMVNYLAGRPRTFGFDARLYALAAEAWLSGRDPWMPALFWDRLHPAITYAGPPPTLIPFIALAWIPADALVLAVVLATAAAALWTLRRLGLPIWWLLFPPLIQGVWVGNLNVFVIALLIWGGTAAGAVATIFKVYAAVPLMLLGRWKPIALAAVIGLLTAPFLPWPSFLAQYPRISTFLAAQAWGGQHNAFTTPLVTVGAAIGLVLLGRHRAVWLAVPVLWPATQVHYSLLALPALTPPLAFFAAINQPGFLAFGVILYAVWVRRDQLRPLLRAARPRSLR